MQPQDGELSNNTADTHCPRCDSTELAPEQEGEVCMVCERQEGQQ